MTQKTVAPPTSKGWVWAETSNLVRDSKVPQHPHQGNVREGQIWSQECPSSQMAMSPSTPVVSVHYKSRLDLQPHLARTKWPSVIPMGMCHKRPTKWGVRTFTSNAGFMKTMWIPLELLPLSSSNKEPPPPQVSRGPSGEPGLPSTWH